jgi:hypothetical protein
MKPYNDEKKPHSFDKDPKIQFINFFIKFEKQNSYQARSEVEKAVKRVKVKSNTVIILIG